MDTANPHSIAVVVPVYNAWQETQACIRSILANTRLPYQLFVIDDASPDRRVWPGLQAFARRYGHVHCLRNSCNRGYTTTVNRGCAMAGASDVLLLNSDTVVTAGWLEKIAACAAGEDVATVTPLSNAAGAFSVPVRNRVNRLPASWDIEAYSRLVERLSPGLRPRVPVGNGFCLYVTRKALQRTGGFDPQHFPLGYGSENDFCMRAAGKGFVHLIEDATFVFHRRSASFGWRKYPVIRAAEKELCRLHPEYKSLVAEWLAADPLEEFRRLLRRSVDSAGGKVREKRCTAGRCG